MTRSKTHGPKYETNYGNWEYLDMISNYVSIYIHSSTFVYILPWWGVGVIFSYSILADAHTSYQHSHGDF
jgi:hypothetical protein